MTNRSLNLRQRIKNRWRQYAEKYGANPQATIRDLEFRKLNTFIVSKYLKRNDYILDIACGNGYSTATYCKYVKTAVGIDYLPQFIKIANKKYQKLESEGKIKFQTGDILKLREEKKYDKIICERTLNNLTSWNDQKKAIFNLYEALKPNGLLLLVEPTVQGHKSVDKVLKELNLPMLEKYWSNFYLDEIKFESFAIKYFKIVEKKHFGTYQLISKIFYPLYANPRKMKFHSKINKIARIISEKYLGENGISHTVLYVLKK